ncbi:response regulator [Flavobacterium eburneipallidum]|uniref:response regulator n=1 Tax=Flavobacterium eburneipallidum TaxID=3003263 RepID=UPI0022ABFDFA|nr:response regulator [Flavobacterium eburneipallidum]
MLDTVLCIDDDPIALMLCKMVISKTMFSNEIITAKNGLEGLNYFKNLKENNESKQPQLILLDLNMPIMGGWEFLDSFSTQEYDTYNSTKIIILSSTIDPDDLEKSKNYAMVLDFLPKPISKEMLEYVKTKFVI